MGDTKKKEDMNELIVFYLGQIATQQSYIASALQMQAKCYMHPYPFDRYVYGTAEEAHPVMPMYMGLDPSAYKKLKAAKESYRKLIENFAVSVTFGNLHLEFTVTWLGDETGGMCRVDRCQEFVDSKTYEANIDEVLDTIISEGMIIRDIK